jgi:hypothetical protein
MERLPSFQSFASFWANSREGIIKDNNKQSRLMLVQFGFKRIRRDREIRE